MIKTMSQQEGKFTMLDIHIDDLTDITKMQ